MTPGKSGRPNFSFRRAETTARVTFDVGISEPPPPPPAAMAGGEFSNGYNYHLPSPRYSGKNVSFVVETVDFLRSCCRCHRRLSPGRDIYMYRGDAAFCSQECREQQMNQDERKERRAGMAKNGESQSPEVAAAAAGSKTLAAA